MLEVRRDADLGQKALDAEQRAELGIQDLERDLPVMLDVAREIDRRHAAGADLTLDLVPARESRVQDVGYSHRRANHRSARLGLPASLLKLKGGRRRRSEDYGEAPHCPRRAVVRGTA